MGRTSSSLLSSLVLLAGAAAAQEAAVSSSTTGPVASETLHRVTIIAENDKFAGTDRFYTNGFKLAYQRSDVGTIAGFFNDVISLIPFLEAEPLAYGFVFGQDLYTPEDTQEVLLIPQDRLYGAWLYGGVSLTRGNRRERDQPAPGFLFQDRIELLVGAVGTGALGETVQNNWHQILNVDTSKGWDNQLKTEWGIQLYTQRKWLLKVWPWNGWAPGADFLPSVGVALGTVFTHFSIGGTFRFGWNLRDDFGPVQRIASAGMDMLAEPRGVRFYLFARVEGRAVLWNAFLDGNLFRSQRERPSTDGVGSSHHIESENFVADLEVGAALQVWWFDVSFTSVTRTREFEEQRDTFTFGAVQVSVTF